MSCGQFRRQVDLERSLRLLEIQWLGYPQQMHASHGAFLVAGAAAERSDGSTLL